MKNKNIIRSLIKELPIIISDGNYSSKYPRAEEMLEEGIPFIRANNMKKNTVVWDDMKYISEEKHLELKKGHLKTDDVLIGVRGDIGKLAIVPSEFNDANINAQIALLRIEDKNIINPKYLLYAFQEPEVLKEIERNQTGSALKQLPINKLKEIKILIQPIETQKKIVEVLDKAQELIDKRKEQIKAMDELVKSRFIEMFGDPITNPKNFDMNKLKDISTYLKRGVSPKYVDNSNIRVINQKCIYWRDLKKENCKYYDESFKEKVENVLLRENDILINSTGTGTLGRCVKFNIVNKYNYIADSHVTVLRSIEGKLNSDFFAALFEFKNVQDTIYRKCVNGSTNQIELSVSKLGEYSIIIPPIELQNQFADFVNQVDKLKSQMETSLKELEDNFNSLMQKAFKGELF